MKRKKIEKEKKHLLRVYAPIIKAGIVLLILVGLLIGVVLFKPEKKEDVKDPSILPTNEILINNNDAKCDGPSATNMKEEAAKIAIAYEVVDDYFFGYMAETDDDLNGNGVIDEDPVVEDIGYALKIKLLNLPEDLYVVITNDIDEDVKTFHHSDIKEDGIVTWFESDTIFMRTYDVKILSNNEGCTNEVYREFNVSLPKYNIFSRSYDCHVEPAKSLDVCQTFIFSNKSTSEEETEYRTAIRQLVLKRAKEQEKANNGEEETEEENKSQIDKVIDFVKENVIIVSIVGGCVLIAIILLIIKKGKK